MACPSCPLYLKAIWNDHVECLRQHLGVHGTLQDDLITMCYQDYVPGAKLLLSMGASVHESDSKGDYPLLTAMEFQSVSMIRYLVYAGAKFKKVPPSFGSWKGNKIYKSLQVYLQFFKLKLIHELTKLPLDLLEHHIPPLVHDWFAD